MPTHKPFTHVIFDLDGTLLNTLDDLTDAANWVCCQQGWPTHTPKEYCYMIGNGAAVLVERMAPEHARTPERMAEGTAQFVAYYGAHREDKTRPYDGLPQVIQRLKEAGLVLAVLTNKPDVAAGPMMERYFPNMFSVVQGGRDGVPLKPNPTPVDMVLACMGARKENTLFVGDSNVDIQTAKNSDIAGCGVLWGFRTREELEGEGADFIASKPSDLLNIILGE